MFIGSVLGLMLLVLGAAAGAQPVTLEPDTNRPGRDYRDFELKRADPEACRQACVKETRCRAFTYVKPGVRGPRAHCWLKDAAPAEKQSSCCVSGVKTQKAVQRVTRSAAKPELRHLSGPSATRERPEVTVRRPPELAATLAKQEKELQRRQAKSREQLRRISARISSSAPRRAEATAALQRYVVPEPTARTEMAVSVTEPRRDTPGARIFSFDPTPVVVGHEVTIRGERFGRRGRVNLDVAGLRLAPPVRGWSEAEIVVEMPPELAPLIGESETSARMWVYADAGGATGALRIAPDPATLEPVIRRISPSTIEPGIDVAVEGERFLSDHQGAVELDCRSLGARFPGTVTEWSDALIGVRFAPGVSRDVVGLSCDLMVRNHVGREATTSAGLTVHLDREEIIIYYRRARQIFLERSTTRYVFDWPGALLNGWLVHSTDLDWSDDGSGGYAEWIERPAVGSSDTRAEIDVGCRGRPGLHSGCAMPDGLPSEVVYTVVIEGPLGLPGMSD
jgi:hypothetical protein